jgi:type I pantothenate kinase
VGAARRLRRDRARFLGVQGRRTPFVIGIGGSVAVGKSTTARLLTELMRRWSDTPRVALVPTDGFLYPNAELERLGLMDRKGFPESYDRAALLRFVSDIKSGLPEVSAPVYSHVTYDIVPGRRVLVDRPDIVIIEGLNVLQPAGSARKAADVAGPPRRLGQPPQAVAPRPTGGRQSGSPRGEQRTTGVPSPPSGTPNRLPDLMVSDFFDFSIYLDAPVALIRRWYVERFLELRETAFGKPGAYFHRYQDLSDAEAVRVAGDIWERINEPNLVDNIEPTRSRATLILQKGPDHKVTQVKLRRL